MLYVAYRKFGLDANVHKYLLYLKIFLQTSFGGEIRQYLGPAAESLTGIPRRPPENIKGAANG